MVENQIRKRGVSDDAVLSAMESVPRHMFVPEAYAEYAYADSPLPIGFDQTISQPYIVAYMTESLQLDSTDRVLEIGTGSGYQAAVLGEIADSVFSIEIIPELADRSEKIIQKLGYSNIRIIQGDGYSGWAEKAPFSKIIITAAPPDIPEKLIEQLDNNGLLIAPVGVHFQQLVLLQKKNGSVSEKRLLPVRFVPMVRKVNPSEKPD